MIAVTIFCFLCYNVIMEIFSADNGNRERKAGALNVEVAGGFREEWLQAIMKLEKECFPVEMQYPADEAEEYYRKMLEGAEYANVFLKDGGKIVGYCLGQPLEAYFDYLKKLDPEMKFEEGVMYIDTIEIAPGSQGKGGANKLLLAVCEEGKKKGFVKFAIHARRINEFNVKLKKLFAGKILASRDIEKWAPAQDEPYEYIEWGK